MGTLTDLVELTGGVFRMGSQQFYPDEGPVHDERVEPFAIEQHPVTNAQFSEFVSDTGYLTVAERPLDEGLFPGLAPEELEPGALVFTPTPGPVDLSNWRQWWGWSVGASWRHPLGPESSIEDRADHTVVQVAYPDAKAYAIWAGRRLPSEAELVRTFGASRITVGRAVRDLQTAGLVERRAGSGTYVKAAPAAGGLSFGLLIPDLGETEIFEPMCQGMMASPLAREHALVWGSVNSGGTAKDEHA